MNTFISYSRVNSAFVVRLARDLKAAGFDVWLDQLDIPKGARWDDEIEAAVERASTFMIVLAPESMESQNVKDELSYAIDSGKYILPVVIKPCKIPLRLRRFQYVDFTDKPYKDSLADIKHLLSNTRQIPKPPLVEDAPLIEPEEAFVSIDQAMAQREQVYSPEPIKAERPEAESSRRKFLVPVMIVAAIVIAAIGVFAVSAARSNRNVPPPVSSSFTAAPILPTETPTITPTPLPKQITDFNGVTMMLVRAGEFVMGDADGSADESPVQKLYLSDFYIDKYEVTNGSYKACVDAGQCKPPLKDASGTRKGYYSKPEYKKYPVVNVTWDMASDYCGWRGARLPTEAEWEKAARGPAGNTYPWGSKISCDQSNFSGCGKDTEAVSSYEGGQSPYEVYDLAGNVSEWVNSLYEDYPYSSALEDPMASGERVVRGGSFANGEQEARATARQKADPSTAQDDIGFRCVGMPSGSRNISTLMTVTPTANPATRSAKLAEEQAELVAQLLATLPPGATLPPEIATLVEELTVIPDSGTSGGSTNETPEGITPANTAVTPDNGTPAGTTTTLSRECGIRIFRWILFCPNPIVPTVEATVTGEETIEPIKTQVTKETPEVIPTPEIGDTPQPDVPPTRIKPTDDSDDPPPPTVQATDPPTEQPTDPPTDPPTDAPTDVPTDAPTDAPTDPPTDPPQLQQDTPVP